MITLDTVRRIEAALAGATPKRHVAKQLGVSIEVVYDVVNGTHSRQLPKARQQVSTAVIYQAEQALAEGLPTRQVAKTLGISRPTVRRIKARLHQLQISNPKYREVKRRTAGYVPSPEQIAAECMAIQSGWSELERERRRRWATSNQPHDFDAEPAATDSAAWTPPEFSERELVA